MITPASNSPDTTASGIRSNMTSTGTQSGHSVRSSSAAVVSGPGIATRFPLSDDSERASLCSVALGGTYAPSWYHTPASQLPPSKGRKSGAASLKLGKSRDDKRRHFVRDEVVTCKQLTHIDLFLTHEAPRPFYPAGRRIDAGKTVLNDVLAAMKPRLHLFGHHHEFTDSMRQSIRSIGLDVVAKSYLLIDSDTFKTERLDT